MYRQHPREGEIQPTPRGDENMDPRFFFFSGYKSWMVADQYAKHLNRAGTWRLVACTHGTTMLI
jgi:hypothetical protein